MIAGLFYSHCQYGQRLPDKKFQVYTPLCSWIQINYIEKFTTWQVNSTLHFTRKTDIALIASRFVRYQFFKWNLTWNSLVRQWIFLESHSSNHWSKTKRFPFYFMSRSSAETKETLSKSMRFLVLLSVSGFPKILNFNSRFGKHSFSVNSFISKVFFS